MIERAASNPAMDLERMERLIQMKMQIEAQQARKSYYGAFSQLQSELPNATRNGHGHTGKKYARFEDVIDALRPHLSAHGFSLSHKVNTEGGQIRVTGILAHADGHAEQTEMVLPPDTSGGKTPVHAMGSSISYGKRYVTLTLTGIATDDDDDAKLVGKGETINEAQYKELADLITATGTDLAKFLAFGNVESLSDIPTSKFEAAKAKLLAKKAMKAKAGVA